MINARWLPEEFWEIVKQNPKLTFEQAYARWEAQRGADQEQHTDSNSSDSR